MTDDNETMQILTRLWQEGRAAVQASPERAEAFANSLAIATCAAVKTPGCEVRVTCRSFSEMVFARFVLEEAMEKHHNRLDKDRSTFDLVELTNGSCIRVLIEEKTDATKPQPTDA